MEEDTTGLLGKKVFFLYPHSVIQQNLLDILIQSEYEIYLINSHTKMAKLAEKFPESILFINIDETLSSAEWEEYVKSLIINPLISNVKIGILTNIKNDELARKYLMDLMVPCGFIVLREGLAASGQIILKMLEANEAKGRRKYVRAFCEHQVKTSFNAMVNDVLYTGKIVDISVVGVAIMFDQEVEFPMKTGLKNIQLVLKGIICRVSGVIAAYRRGDRGCHIILFEADTDPEVKDKIRTFIHKQLQSDMDKIINELEP